MVRAGAHQALGELREVIGQLHDDPVPDGTEQPVPELTDLPGLVEESRAVGTAVQVTGEVGGVPGMAGRTAYRVVQDALTNARKHAPGQPVRIALGGEAGARLEIDVTNPLGPAGDPQRVAGHGLVGLTERVRLAAWAARPPADRRRVPAAGLAAVAAMTRLLLVDDDLVRAGLTLMRGRTRRK